MYCAARRRADGSFICTTCQASWDADEQAPCDIPPTYHELEAKGQLPLPLSDYEEREAIRQRAIARRRGRT